MPNGKGSGRRPAAISDAEMDLRWELAFGGKKVDPDLPAVISGFPPLPVCAYCGGTACKHQAATERWLRGEEAYPTRPE